jgi:REP element-mobilizing transposase RayT
MSIPSRSDGAGTYFVTSATFNRRRLFQVAANAELFLEVLQKYRREDHFKLHAFVVMPDHIHLLLTPQCASIERVVGLIKGASLIRWVRSSRCGNVDLRTTASGRKMNSIRGASIFIKIQCEQEWWKSQGCIRSHLLIAQRHRNSSKLSA